MKVVVCLFLLFMTPWISVYSGEVDVVKVDVVILKDNQYRFDVTLLHADEGWKHYADKWDVVGPDGTIYGTRTLLHPHVNEQPFTRSLSGVTIHKGIRTVTIQGHDSVHQYGGKTIIVELPQ